MAKIKKQNRAVEDSEPTPEYIDVPGPIMGQPLQVAWERDRLWELYVARVAKAETVNTMRRDGKAIFRDAFLEARVAFDVFLEMTNGGQKS